MYMMTHKIKSSICIMYYGQSTATVTFRTSARL